MKISESEIRGIISEEIDKVLFEKIQGRSRTSSNPAINIGVSKIGTLSTINTSYGTIILDDPDASYMTPVPVLDPGDLEYFESVLGSKPSADRGGRAHTGWDITVPAGTPVAAIADGVARVHREGKCGWGVTITHSDQNINKTIYCHLSQINVSNGQNLTMGEIIGLSGGLEGAVGSGNSTGAHLHFSIDQSINPGVYRAIFNNASTWTIGNDTRALAAAESDIEDDSTEEDDDNEIVIVI